MLVSTDYHPVGLLSVDTNHLIMRTIFPLKQERDIQRVQMWILLYRYGGRNPLHHHGLEHGVVKMVKRIILATDPPEGSNGGMVLEMGPEIVEGTPLPPLEEEDNVIAAVEGFTPLSVQTSAQATAVTNTTARLLYATATRTQGNFSLFYAQAKRDLAQDLVHYNLTLDDDDTITALAYLVWHRAIMKFPSWDAASVSLGGDSESRKPGTTSAMTAYMQLLKGSKRYNRTPPTIGKVDDATYYDDRLNPANLNPEGVPNVLISH